VGLSMFQFIVYESKTHHEDNYKIIILQQGLIFIVLQIHYLFAHTRLTPAAMNLFSPKGGRRFTSMVAYEPALQLAKRCTFLRCPVHCVIFVENFTTS
jgi:hypothetical protein